MIKKLASCIREYKGLSIATLIFMVFEAVIETLIPYITATSLINTIQKSSGNLDMKSIIKVGVLLVVLALFSLVCGGTAGLTSAKASA